MAVLTIKNESSIHIGISWKENSAVRIAAENLKNDLKKVLGTEVTLGEFKGGESILVGTAGVSAEIEGLFDEKKLQDKNGNFRKEAYIRTVSKDRLVIVGTDRRGTIYGIYDLCEEIGVSPWYFWADVPVKKKEWLVFPEDYEIIDYPSVEYRGIFINDEEELERWAKLHMEEDTIGVHTYEKIFELLLRLKANYIWPAMHVNSFNRRKENGALADRMGIVVGTSHCDMLMRSNNREWLPWLKEKGYEGVKYDYTIEGRNREILHEYWRESVIQNRDFEVSYTLGMRGIHDSGFETSNLNGRTEEELRTQKIELLETIIASQNEILKEELDKTPLKLFIPYKEVLELYDHGLKVPDDFTMIWANDNYGYVRRYPSEEDRKRVGGHGIYYHNSYWSPPGRSYLFFCSIPLTHTKYELMKAYDEGIQKLWILNVGALKPLEMEVEFFLRLAWEAGSAKGRTQDVDSYVSDWIDRNFTGKIGEKMGPLLNRFSQIANVRKLEMMEDDVFSQTAYGDEGVMRLHKLQEILDQADVVYEGLLEEEKDAFFQLVLLRIHALYLTMGQYYFSDRSTLCHKQGKQQAADLYVKETRAYEDARRKLLLYYNERISGGKWKGIVTPEDFPPPRTAMYPACTPSVHMGGRNMLVHIWNNGEELCFVRPGTKWFEISNGGEGSFAWRAETPDWIQLSETSGEISCETRILVTVKETQEEKTGIILIRNETDNVQCEVPVLVSPVPAGCENPEEAGVVSVSVTGLRVDGFRLISYLGREEGDLLEGYKEGAEASFPVYFSSEGEFLLEIHRFPSLNSTGRIRMGVKIDRGTVLTVESLANDEWRDTWTYNSTNNVDKLYLKLPYLKKGAHQVTFKVIDPYFAISRFVIYTKERAENNLGIICAGQVNREFPREQALLNNGRILDWSDRFYGAPELKPRKEIYANREVTRDSLVATDHFEEPVEYGKTKSPKEVLTVAHSLFCEKDGVVKIDAVTAYEQTEFAYTENGQWQYCSSESYGRSGLAIYMRKRGQQWKQEEEAPNLNYQIRCDGGTYDFWVLLRIDPASPSYLGVAADGNFVDRTLLYNSGKTWRYEAEQVWRWIPLAGLALSGGKHVLTLAVLASGVRIDRLYLTRKGDRPPVDCSWE